MANLGYNPVEGLRHVCDGLKGGSAWTSNASRTRLAPRRSWASWGFSSPWRSVLARPHRRRPISARPLTRCRCRRLRAARIRQRCPFRNSRRLHRRNPLQHHRAVHKAHQHEAKRLAEHQLGRALHRYPPHQHQRPSASIRPGRLRRQRTRHRTRPQRAHRRPKRPSQREARHRLRPPRSRPDRPRVQP